MPLVLGCHVRIRRYRQGVDAGNLAEWLTAVFAGFAVLYAARQISHARRQARIARTYGYFERFMDWDFTLRRDRARGFYAARTTDERLKKWQAWQDAALPSRAGAVMPERAASPRRVSLAEDGSGLRVTWAEAPAAGVPVKEVIETVNFFVELAASLENDQLDERLAKRMFQGPTSLFYNECIWLLERLRRAAPVPLHGEFGAECHSMIRRLTGSPWISGASIEGSTLVCQLPREWLALRRRLFAHVSWQWLRDEEEIDGARSRRYVLGEADVLRRIACRVSGLSVHGRARIGRCPTRDQAGC